MKILFTHKVSCRTLILTDQVLQSFKLFRKAIDSAEGHDSVSVGIGNTCQLQRVSVLCFYSPALRICFCIMTQKSHLWAVARK